MSEEDNRFDGIFMSVIQQKQSISGFFEAVFSFLRRQTDFFQDNKKAEKVIIEECKKQFDLFTINKQKKDDEEKQKQLKEAEKKKKKEEEKQKEELQKKINLQEEAEKEKKAKEQEAQKTKMEEEQKQQADKATEEKKPEEGEKKEGEKKEDDEKPPKGNGGRTDKQGNNIQNQLHRYIWTQTLDDLQIYVPIPDNIRSKQLNVQIEADTIVVEIKGQNPPLLKGSFYEKINNEESIWTITDGEIDDYKGRYIHISIEKWKGQMHWWDCVVKGDPKINTQKINPEPSKLQDLDGETRGTVEKMMFDMRQKQMGLPTSEEMEKQSKLSEFMKAHPEMDFSKCKFN